MSNSSKANPKSTFGEGKNTSSSLVITWLLSPAIFYFFTFLTESTILGALMAAIIILSIRQNVFSNRHKKILLKQGIRDQIAVTIFENINERDFTLYLRPFNTAGKLKSSLKLAYGGWFERNIITGYRFSQDGTHEVETILTFILEETSPLVALGYSEDAGAGKIDSFGLWQEDFLELIRYSKLIFIVPLPSMNTEWEIYNLINNKLLYKCIFIMPSELEGLDMEDEWERSVDIYAKLGLSLPEFADDGSFFSYDSSLQINWMLKFEGNTKIETIRTQINSQLKQALSEKDPTSTVALFDNYNRAEDDGHEMDSKKSDLLEGEKMSNPKGRGSFDTSPQTKMQLQEKVGTKSFLSDETMLADKLNYIYGITAFDQFLKGKSVEDMNAVIHLIRYPKGLIIKVAGNFFSVKFGLSFSEIKYIKIMERRSISGMILQTERNSKIVFSFLTEDIVEIISFLELLNMNYAIESLT